MRWTLGLIAAIATLMTMFTGSAQAAPAAPSSSSSVPLALVSVKVADSTHTLFSGWVLTAPHKVTTAQGGTHHCDGTNNGANPTPGPTAIGALDTAAKLHGFAWDGAYFPQFDDYLVSAIDGESSTATSFWDILVNGSEIQVGGCQQQVHTGDHIVYQLTSF